MSNKNQGNCPKCGTWRFKLQRDHIMPKFRGGSDAPSNIQYICANCHEDKTREELSAYLKGRQFTKAHRAKLSAALIGKNKGKPGAMLGRKHSADSIAAMRKAHAGKPWSKARRAAYNRRAK